MAKQHRPTTENREKIRMLASCGVPIHLIPHALDPNHPMDVSTLYKYYDKDIKAGQAQTAALVGQNIAQMAMGSGKEALVAAIFYAKSQMGWYEKAEHIKIEPTQEFLTVLQKVNNKLGSTSAEHELKGITAPAKDDVDVVKGNTENVVDPPIPSQVGG